MKNPKTQKDVQAQMSEFLPVSWLKNGIEIMITQVYNILNQKCKSNVKIFRIFVL